MRFGIAGNLDKTELPGSRRAFDHRFQSEQIPYVLHDMMAKGLRGKIEKQY